MVNYLVVYSKSHIFLAHLKVTAFTPIMDGGKFMAAQDMKTVAHLSRSPVISTSISRSRGSCVWWKCPISKRKNHEIAHALEQRATSKVPNRVFRPRKSHEWGPPAISQHACVSGRNMIYEARNGAKSETKRRRWLFANDKCTRALCHTRWCCRLRAFTFAALCVSLLELSCACVIEFFMRAELFCTHIVWCCMSGLRTANKLWRVTCWENDVAVWEQYTRASTVTHRQSDFSLFNMVAIFN
jgi:hypothetical protein